MATVTPTLNNDIGSGDGSVRLFTWAMVTASVEGLAFEMTEYADVCFQCIGTNWGGATVALQGSNDGVTYFPLSNAAGAAAATFSADGGKTVIERPRYMRPYLTTAGTAAVISVTACIRRANPLRT